MDDLNHATADELEAGLATIRLSPRDPGVVRLIVRRPIAEQREILDSGELHPSVGLVGDTWGQRRDQSPETQLTIMNSRTIALLARRPDRWSLAGDQLYADMDLGDENLPAGTRLAVGTAVLEVTATPHLGCKKFSARFGPEALRFVNSTEGRKLRLRGMYAMVVIPGAAAVGDLLKKV